MMSQITRRQLLVYLFCSSMSIPCGIASRDSTGNFNTGTPLSRLRRDGDIDTTPPQPVPEPDTGPKPVSEPQASFLEPSLDVVTNTFLALMYICMFLIIATNVCVIATVCCEKTLRTTSNALILSLSVADICVSVFVIPAPITSLTKRDAMSDWMCKLCHYATHVSMAASVHTLIAIAWYRFRGVVYPLKPKITLRKTSVIIATVWLVALVYAVRAPVAYALFSLGNGKVSCTFYPERSLFNGAMFILDFLVLFAVPSIFLGVLYGILTYSLKSNAIQQTQVASARKNKRVVRMLVCLYALFVICNLPINVYRLKSFVGFVAISGQTRRILGLSLFVLFFTNSFLNPVFYALFNPKIRSAFLEMTRLSRLSNSRSNRVSQAPSTTLVAMRREPTEH